VLLFDNEVTLIYILDTVTLPFGSLEVMLKYEHCFESEVEEFG
jgi:hypothetical protein